MHKWQDHTKLNPLPYLEVVLILACIMALFLVPGATEWAYSITRQILTLGT